MSDTEAPPAEEAPAPEDAAPAVIEADAAAPAAPEGGGAAPAAPAGGNSEALTLSAQSDQGIVCVCACVCACVLVHCA